jgi:Mg-chelatase subunit ChlD
MESKYFAYKVLGVEALLVAALGTLAFFYARSMQEAQGRGTTPTTTAPASAPQPLRAFATSYIKDSRSVKELTNAMQLRPEIDLIAFVIDTSASMNDDRDELKANARTLSEQFKGRAFEVVNFADTAQVAGEPTRNLTELQRQIDAGVDLGGIENGYQALVVAANKAHEKFKHPALVLMTDAAPNDGMPGSTSPMTIEQAANALNAANAELYVWAAFDLNEYMANGSAATSPLYPDLVSRTKAGGKVYFIKRNNFDPNWLVQH